MSIHITSLMFSQNWRGPTTLLLPTWDSRFRILIKGGRQRKGNGYLRIAGLPRWVGVYRRQSAHIVAVPVGQYSLRATGA